MNRTQTQRSHSRHSRGSRRHSRRRGHGWSGPGGPQRDCVRSSRCVSSWHSSEFILLKLPGWAPWAKPDCNWEIFLDSSMEQCGGGEGGEVVFPQVSCVTANGRRSAKTNGDSDSRSHSASTVMEFPLLVRVSKLVNKLAEPRVPLLMQVFVHSTACHAVSCRACPAEFPTKVSGTKLLYLDVGDSQIFILSLQTLQK